MIITINIESLSQCTNDQVRLVGSLILNQGTVQVCIDSLWGAVCRDGWDNNDAAVVCDQLGYGRDGKILLIYCHMHPYKIMTG